jgi:2-polyprenyl-6-methoxyphenol hydroxylase-like FAD-dependent oxidoreductase
MMANYANVRLHTIVSEAVMSAQPMQTEVLIAGAGPVGLALAAELKRLGVSAMIIDRQAAGANTSRACVIHARTLEVLEPLGATPDLIGQGVKVPTFRARDRDRTLLTISFANNPSAYRYALMCPQDRTERILLNRLERLGGSVVRESEFTRFAESVDYVDVDLDTRHGPKTVRTRWLVGCDGMHSKVREQSGIAFQGAAYSPDFVLADVRMDWPLGPEEVTLFYSQEGFVVVAALPEQRYRIVATVDEAPERPNADFMQDILNRRGPALRRADIREVVWSSRFHIHHRVAETSRKGRILLCGDAAHVHSPAGGHGMNIGVQDSMSLAGILVKTLRDGDTARLDAWAAERHRIASSIVALTDRLTRMATIKSSAGKALRNSAFALAGQLPLVRSRLAKTLAELNDR